MESGTRVRHIDSERLSFDLGRLWDRKSGELLTEAHGKVAGDLSKVLERQHLCDHYVQREAFFAEGISQLKS
jgi:hypothetical protein